MSNEKTKFGAAIGGPWLESYSDVLFYLHLIY